MSPEIAVSARNLGKFYRLYDRPVDRLLESVTRRTRSREFRALEGISFDLKRGQALGVIGENGSGKSTLLKIVAGTTTPSEGTVETRGTVASILELGTGFHPEFSGAENARINAALLGLSASEIRTRMPAIREFAELGDFFDQPVKTYSSGMALRLAFSVATNVDADVVIIDEALSVGDGYFQKKSIDRIVEYKKGGGTLLLCSHAMYHIAMLCEEALWCHRGQPRATGAVLPVIRRYEAYLEEKERTLHRASSEPAPAGSRTAWITDVVIHDGKGSPRNEFAMGETVGIDVVFQAASPSLAFHVRVGIDREDGVQVYSVDTSDWEAAPLSGRETYCVRLALPEFPVTHGDFRVSAFVGDDKALFPHDLRVVSQAFTIHSPRYIVGLVNAVPHWSLVESQVPAEYSKA
jgi:ABC-type polysaccharide/polyol phosphate transport system ATPase subunit